MLGKFIHILLTHRVIKEFKSYNNIVNFCTIYLLFPLCIIDEWLDNYISCTHTYQKMY